MKILVTGAAGFLGRAAVTALVAAGHEVTGFDLAAPPAGPQDGGIPFVRGDLLDTLALADAVRRSGADAIVHLAAILALESDREPLKAVRVNAEGAVSVLELARVMGLRRIVYASSAAVFNGYGSGAGPMANDAPPRPRNVYGQCKAFVEGVAGHYRRAFGVDSIGLRFSVINGRGKKSGVGHALTSELIDKPAAGLPGRVPYADDACDWLYIEDAAGAILRAVEAGEHRSDAYNVGGEFASIRRAMEVVRSLLPEARLEGVPGVFGFSPELDVSLTRAELGYEPRFPLEEQLRRLIEETRALS
jgi:UDP-glucose 4-epimerase